MTKETSSFKISELLYKTLNVDELKSIISGAVYREQKPIGSELQDVVIVSKFLNSDYQLGINNGEVHINAFCKKIAGRCNTLKLKQITDKIIEILKDNKMQNSQGFYFDIANQTNFEDIDQNSMCFISITLKVHI